MLTRFAGVIPVSVAPAWVRARLAGCTFVVVFPPPVSKAWVARRLRVVALVVGNTAVIPGVSIAVPRIFIIGATPVTAATGLLAVNIKVGAKI